MAPSPTPTPSPRSRKTPPGSSGFPPSPATSGSFARRQLTEAELDYLTNIDYQDHFAWTAFALDDPGQPGIGVARFIRLVERPEAAEAAVTVIDAYQGRGCNSPGDRPQ